MATQRSQRIGIWIIAIAMMLGTVGGFIAMMVAPTNEAKDKAALDAELEQYSKAVQEYQDKVSAQGRELSDRYFTEFSSYSERVSAFEAGEVKDLGKNDLKVGDGQEVKGDTKLAVYYIGWNPNGEIFDGSIEGESLKSPFTVDGPEGAPVIMGWQEGLIGMKIGGVRELTIPSEKAYGEAGGGEKIPANAPLKFVVMAIEPPTQIAEPEMPPLVRKEYMKYER